MKIGAIGYGTDQGLGILLKDFYDNGIVDEVLQVKHRTFTNHWDRFGKNRFDFPEEVEAFLNWIDVLLCFETPFDMNIVARAKEKKIKTVLVPMYECTNLPTAFFDHIISPSKLDQAYYPNSDYLPVPVPKWVPWRKRSKAEVFVHNAGHGGVQGRNGTKELINAMKLVRSPLRLIIRSQKPIYLPNPDPRIDVRVGTFARETLYHEGHVFVFPERFNGLSLPLQEAKASGMLLMGTDRFPINTWTQRDCLIPSYTSRNINPFGVIIKEDLVSPTSIAHTMDEWYGKNISGHSEAGKRFREQRSWDVLGPDWLRLIRS